MVRNTAASPTDAQPSPVEASRLPAALALKIELVPTASLKPYPGHARTHSKKQISQIAASIRQNGFLDPVLIDRDGTVIAGHGRVAAAQLLSLAEVPAIRADHLSDNEARIYRLAANKLALNSGWDQDLLALELQGLEELNLNTPLELTGFDGAELDQLLELKPAPPKPSKDDRIPEPGGPEVTKPGDLWMMGDHRLLCADARAATSYQALMGGEFARMVFADPPFNCPIDGYVGGLGKTKHSDFVMGSGELSPADFLAFLTDYMREAAAVSEDGAIHYHCMDWKGLATLLAAGAEVYEEQKNLIVWVKSNGGMGSFYRSRHEHIAVFKVGTAQHVNNFGLGDTGRYRTNAWEYPGVNAFGRGRDEQLGMHPTCKSVAMVADAIKDVSRPGEIVLDPFGGSGTTLIAAAKTRRRARLIELDPLYCDVICRRWRKFSGEPARQAETGLTFDALEASTAKEIQDERLQGGV